MFSTLYTLLYNNYYNRIVKKEETLSNYQPYIIDSYPNYNFNINDHISTTVILNMSDSASCDYLIEVDTYNEIKSRWFIIESTRVRGNQYKLTLYRDTVADYYNIIIKAPCFIEKATLSSSSPLLFNNENMTFNQIKTRETLLKDESDCAWLVGYCAKDLEDKSGAVKINREDDLNVIAVAAATIQDWSYYRYTNSANAMRAPTTQATINFNFEEGQTAVFVNNYVRASINPYTGVATRNILQSKPAHLYYSKWGSQINANTIASAFSGAGLQNFIVDTYLELATETAIQNLNFYNGKIIKTNDGKYYSVNVRSESLGGTKDIPRGSDLFINMSNCLTSRLGMEVKQQDVPTGAFWINYSTLKYTIELEELTELSVNYNFKGSNNRLITEDAVWDMFAIPYGDIKVKGLAATDQFEITTNKEIGLKAIRQLAVDLSDSLYDMQLLPYCPIPNLITAKGELTVLNDKQYSKISSGDTPYSIIFYAPSTNLHLRIYKSIPIGTTALERKVNNECDKWRLCSPDYSNYFDFSAEKNGGVSYFDIDCTYKPFTPYIHINPNFGYLYGQDFNDPRGLITGTNYSLTQVEGAWETYELQNKNYDAAFKRQLQNMEINNKWEHTRDIASAVSGTISGAGTGAAIGGMIGLGTGAGAVLGGMASGIAGAADVQINQALRNEALNYMEDMHGYQLGNIQALPDTLTKVDAFTPNNKIFPVLEYYTCTDIEKDALRNKIYYNGMTTMVIGTIESYIQPNITYIKGKIIRLDELEGEYHLANTIAKELNLGVFI